MCRSTFAAELNAATGGLDEAQFAALLLHEVLCGFATSWTALSHQFEKGKLSVPIDLLTDCRSLYDSTINLDDRRNTETNIYLHLQCFRQDFRHGRFRKMVWCSTRDMIADGLTKSSVGRDHIRNCLATGRLTLHEPPLVSTTRTRTSSKPPKKKTPRSRRKPRN